MLQTIVSRSKSSDSLHMTSATLSQWGANQCPYENCRRQRRRGHPTAPTGQSRSSGAPTSSWPLSALGLRAGVSVFTFTVMASRPRRSAIQVSISLPSEIQPTGAANTRCLSHRCVSLHTSTRAVLNEHHEDLLLVRESHGIRPTYAMFWAGNIAPLIAMPRLLYLPGADRV